MSNNIVVPSPPIFNIINITHSQFVLGWKTPKYLAGNLNEFELTLEWEVGFLVPNWCTPKSPKENIIIQNLNGSTFTFEYLDARAYTNYKAKIRAKTTAGWGNYSEYLVFQTPAGGKFSIRSTLNN